MLNSLAKNDQKSRENKTFEEQVDKKCKHCFQCPGPGKRQTDSIRRAQKDGDHEKAPDSRRRKMILSLVDVALHPCKMTLNS